MTIVEIRDSNPDERSGRFLSFDLADILPCIEPVGKDLNWAVLELQAVGTDDLNILDLENRINAVPTGVVLKWSELVDLASRIRQVADGIFVGYRAGPPSSENEDLRQSCDVVIEAIDASMWRIFAADMSVVDCLMVRFREVKQHDDTDPIPGSHG